MFSATFHLGLLLFALADLHRMELQRVLVQVELVRPGPACDFIVCFACAAAPPTDDQSSYQKPIKKFTEGMNVKMSFNSIHSIIQLYANLQRLHVQCNYI